MTLPFSAVMALYSREQPYFLEGALQSLLNQTCQPDEIIIVADGALTCLLEEVLQKYQPIGPIKIIRLESSQGPGYARHAGILESKNEIIAIMDSDDICLPDRFSLQLKIISDGEVDIVGGWIEEFSEMPGDLGLIRKVPEYDSEIKSLARWRSPMNNVTAMFKKEIYLRAGGFGKMRSFEDYDLYVRMIMQGARFKNIQKSLVNVRGGGLMIARRGGLQQIPVELAMLWRMYVVNFLRIDQLIVNSIVRSSVRILPNKIREWFYRHILRRLG